MRSDDCGCEAEKRNSVAEIRCHHRRGGPFVYDQNWWGWLKTSHPNGNFEAMERDKGTGKEGSCRSIKTLKTLCRAKEDTHAEVQISGRADAVDSVSAGEKNSSFTSASALSKELDDDMEASSKDSDEEKLGQEHLQKLKDFLGQQGGKLDGDWSVSVKKRAHSEKAFDVMYFSPDKQKFRSKLEVARFLGVLEQRKEDASLKEFSSSVGRGRKREVPQEPHPSDEELTKRRRMEAVNSLESQDHVSNLEHQLPFQSMDLRVEALGVTNRRPGYYNEHFVWPVGYRCSWHDGVTGSICTSEVIDGGHSPPIFRVTRTSCNVSDLCNNRKDDLLQNPKESSMEVCQEAQAKSESNMNPVYDEDHELNMLQAALAGFLDGDARVSLAGDENENVCPGSTAPKNLHQAEGMFVKPESRNCATTTQAKEDEIGDIVVESSSSWGAWRLLAEQVVSRAAILYERGSFQLGCKHVESSLLSALGLNVFNSLEGPAQGRLHDAQFFFTKLSEWMGQDRFGFNIPVIQKYLEAQRAKLELPRPPPPMGSPICEKVSPDFVGDLLQIWEFLCRFADILGQKEPPSLEELEEIVADASHMDARKSQNKRAMPMTSQSASQDGSLLQNHAVASTVQSQELIGTKRFTRSKTFSSPGCCSAALAASNIALLKIALSDLQQMVSGGGSDLTFEPKRGKKKEGEAAGSLKKKSANFMPLNDLTWPEVARRYVIGLLTLSTCGENLDISVQERRKILRCIQGDGGVLCGALDGVAAIEADALLLATAEKQLSRWLPGAEDKPNSDSAAKPRSECKPSEAALAGGTSRKPAWAFVLEPVRKLATNVGARIRNCVREALEMNPPDWARETLEWSISKDVYKGNASGPTKRAVLSVLEKVADEKFVIPLKVEKKVVKYMAATPALVMKRCRIILRELVMLDEVRIFCNSLGGTVLGYFEKEDDNMEVPLPLVARPLDFRMIDCRLAAWSYGDSHEFYAADMRQLFQNIPIIFHDREDLIKVGEEMSQRFEALYEEKVIKLVSGKEEIVGLKETNQADATEGNGVATEDKAKLSSTEEDEELKKAPWEEGVCKICGVDKDDDSTLLCDGCDAEYHIYCLEPPLSMIPEGNWYCPGCVAGVQGGSTSCTAVAEPSGTIFKQLHQSRLSEAGSILSTLVRSMDGKDYWHLTGSERVRMLKFLCDKVLESTVIRDHIDQSIEALPELQQRLRVLLIERQSMNLINLHPVQNIAQIQNGNILSQSLGKQNCVQSLPGSIVEAPGILSTSPASTFIQSVELPAADEQEGPGSMPQGLNFGSQTDKGLATGIPLDTHHASEIEASPLQNIQSTPGKTMLEILEAEIEKVEGELMKMAPRRECLGRDGVGRTYWALGWAGRFPWILAEKGSSADSISDTHFCNQVNMMGQPDVQEWSGYNDSECVEQLLKWLKPTVAAEKLLKSALTKWCMIWSSKYKKEPDKQQTSKMRYATPVTVNTKAATILSKKFGSISQAEGTGEEPSRKRGRKKKSLVDGKIYRCDCLELVWTARIHCPYCHHTYDNVAELHGHNNGTCSWRGFEDESEALIHAKAKKAKNKGQDFQPLDLSIIIKRFTVHTSNRTRVSQIGCLADKGPRFVPAPAVSPLLDPSLHMAATASISSDLRRSVTVNIIKDKIQTAGDTAQSSDGPTRLKNNGSTDIHVSDIRISEDPTAHIGKKFSTSQDQDRDVSGSSIPDETLISGRANSLLALLPPSEPLLMTNMWAFKKLKASLLDIESLLSTDIMETSRSEPNRRRAWRSFVKSATSILELVQSIVLLEQMVKASSLKESWCNWTSLSAGFGIKTLCSLALRIYSLDAAIKYKRSSADPDSDDSEKPNKLGRKKKVSAVQV
ncbi:hypothetical protein GOP47_0009256 [Adiantum capillus-veneris]|uniref:Methyl-CpG-binding domain-containing protein 9 n=1 Tax=Adiantum capillus-veneris TaxID=13818 RepID=A0A9D4UVV7_ADICA|nr:hypothetical protein GOP47_0009256 [Adiantum capillus-veneris]